MKEENKIESVAELEKWFNKNCYNKDSYSINGNVILQGFRLENNGGLFQWSYFEQGEWETLKYFRTEKEAVQYVFEVIRTDEHAKRNYIGMYKSDQETEEILAELKKRNVEYWTDKIPYGGPNDWRTRVFVIGCGIKKAMDLIQKPW